MVHPFAVIIFHWVLNCQANLCNFQFSHHSACVTMDKACSMGAWSRGITSEQFLLHDCYEAKLLGCCSNFCLGLYGVTSHTTQMVFVYLCHDALMHRWLSPWKPRSLHTGLVEGNLSKVIDETSHLTFCDISLSPMSVGISGALLWLFSPYSPYYCTAFSRGWQVF